MTKKVLVSLFNYVKSANYLIPLHMKRIPILTLFVLVYTSAFTQVLRINVKDMRNLSFPYAIIHINNRTIGITDSLGRIEIKLSNIAIGDTIIASGVGITPTKVIFNKEIKEKQILDIIFDDFHSSNKLDTLLINPPDMENFFAKQIKEVYNPWKNGILSARFQVTISMPGTKMRKIEGSFTVENEVTGKNLKKTYQYGYFHHPILFSTQNDTLGLQNLLNTHLHDALRGGTNEVAGFLMSFYSRKMARNNYNIKYVYLGKKDSIMKFRVYFSPKQKPNFAFQSLLFINQMNKELLHSEGIGFFPGNFKVKEFNFATDHLYFRKKKRSSPMLLFKKINYNYEETNGISLNAVINFVDFKQK